MNEGISSVMVDTVKIFNQFEKFEKDYHVFDLKYGETFYWHLIRSWLYRSILKDDREYDDLSKKKGNALQVCRKIAISAISSLINIKQFPLKKNHCDIMFSSSWNFRLVNGKNTDIFVDYLELDKKYKVKTFEYNDSKHISFRRDISSCFIDLKMMFNYLEFSVKKRIIKRDCLPELDNIIGSMNSVLGVNTNVAQVKNRVRYSVCVYSSYYRSIKKYLAAIHPKAVIMTNAYGLRHFATIRAAKELRIKTIELQHGQIGRYHIDYNFADPIGSGRYCPDYLFTFGEYWSDTCSSPSSLKKIAVGYRYIEFIKESQKGILRDPKAVVFYSMKRNDFADFALRFAELDKGQNYKIIFKYHPVECGKADYSQLRGKDIIVIDQPTEVHDFLTRYEHHVSVGSTVLYEGAMRDVSIYVWNISGKESADDLIQSGCARLVKNEHDLLEQIAKPSEYKDIKIKEKLLTSNANDNINNALRKILNEEG